MLTTVEPYAGIAFGFILAEGAHWLHRAWRARRERRAVAGALLHEAVRIAAWCAGHGNSVALFGASSKPIALSALRPYQPPQLGVYERLVPQLCAALPDIAGNVIAFYGAIDLARTWFDTQQGDRPAKSVPERDVRDLSLRWELACRNAVLAIEGLRGEAQLSLSTEERDYIDKLVADLRKLGEGDLLSKSS